MPGAMVKAGYGGIGLIVATAFLSAYCGILLGFAWERVKHTKEGTDVQDPYPHIGEMAYSKFGRHAVTFCLNLNLFLACVIYLLLASETISSLLTFHIQAIPVKEEFRVWLVICASILIPLTWFGTPKDFWGIAVGAAGTTAIASMLITIKCGLVASKAEEPVRQPPVTFISFTSAFGTFVFGFTGAALFPTIQNDMKNSQHFVKAVSFGFAGTFAIYVPVTLAGFLVFGGKVNDSILKTLALYDTAHKTNRAIVSIVEVLFALHFICGFVLMMNPTFQQLEGFFKIKNSKFYYTN